MRSRFRWRALVWSAPGLAVQMYGLCSGDILLGLLGGIWLILSLAYYSYAKGYSFFWGFWGLFPVLGMLPLILMRPRHFPTPREEMDTLVLEEDPAIRPYAAAGRPKPPGGPWLLTFAAPLGIALVLLSPLIALPPSRWPSNIVEDTDTQEAEEAAALTEDEQATQQEEAAPVPVPVPPAATVPNAPPAESKPPEPEPEKKPEAPPSFAEQYAKIMPGMTIEQVTALVGNKTEVVAEKGTGDRIIRWESQTGDSFAARFHEDRAERLTRLHRPPAKTTVTDMAAEIAEATKRIMANNAPAPQAAPQVPPPEAPVDAGTLSDTEPGMEEPAPADQDEGVAPKKVLRVGDPNRAPARTNRKAKLPRFSHQLDRGTNDIRIVNLRESAIKVGIRSDNKGRDVSVSAGGVTTLNIGNGTYTAYYVDSSEPGELKSAGGFTVASPPGPIDVVIR